MSRRDPFDVAVIGAGVVGSAAALALAEEGLRVVVVESREPTSWTPASDDLRVYALAADSQLLLERLGIWRAVADARSQPYRKMRVWDAAGGGELVFDADALGRDSLGHIVEHVLLVDRLWAALSRHPRVESRCPAQLAALEQHEDGVVLSLADGERIRARVALGADGASSRVRELAGIASDAREYGQVGLVAFVETARPHEDTCWQRFLDTGPLAFLPFADGRSSIVWTLPTADAERLLGLEADAFAAELTRAFDARLGDVTRVSARRVFPLARRLATRMLDGRVALIGDAAHVVHPLAGQGMNLGMRDADSLAVLVRDARARNVDWLAPHRWQRWARTRVSENAVAAYSFEAINAIFSNDAVLPTLLRGHLLGIAGKLAPVSRLLWKRAAGA